MNPMKKAIGLLVAVGASLAVQASGITPSKGELVLGE